MRTNLQKMLLVVVALATLAGCAPEKPSEARLRGDLGRGDKAADEGRPSTEIEKQAVVVVDGEEITLGEFNRRLQEMPEFARARFSTTEQKQSYLDSVAQFELMADVAEARGFGERAQVRFALEDALAERLIEQVVAQKLSMGDIEEEAIERYYNAHLDAFRTSEARRVALIKTESYDEAKRLRETVLDQMAEAPDSAVNAFRRAAARHSIERESAKEGGDIGFVDRPRPGAPSGDAPGDQPLAEQVFALSEVGDVTPVFAFDAGFALATFFEEREASVVPLEEATGEIRAKLYEQRKQQLERDFIAELRDSADVERLDDAVAKAQSAPEKKAQRIEDIEVYEVAPFGADADESEGAENADSNEAVSKP